MALWSEWYKCIKKLRPACSRGRTFMWLALCLAGMSIRTECLGITSLIRTIGLKEKCYYQFLHVFHTSALKLDLLTACWIQLVTMLFHPLIIEQHKVLVVDGLKVAKEGRKMPAVKKLHQESNNNSKPEYIWGHSFQVISLLVTGIAGSVFAVPLISRIHEGVVFSNRDKRTLMDKMVSALFSITDLLQNDIILLADSYYANKKVLKPLVKKGMHLVARIRNNAVAYYPPIPPQKKGTKGRKKKYGQKVELMTFFENTHLFTSKESPVYHERKVIISYLCMDLLWRPIGQMVRFVCVNHPMRGKIILITTNLDLDPLKVIATYGYRFKIEVSFKQAINTLGTYAYHFWMKTMTPLKRVSGNQHLHKKSDKYRNQVKRKIRAYHCYVQIGCIAQGLLMHLSVNFGSTVWKSFRSWLRTMKKDLPPSEMVVSYALRSSLPLFLLGRNKTLPLKKFFIDNADPYIMPDWRLGC
jgi:hypothetical protein